MMGQLNGVLPVIGKEREADTGRDLQGQAAKFIGLGQAMAQLIGDPGREIRVGDVVEEGDEFIPTDTAHRVRVPQAPAQALGHRPQELVAHGMSPGVIDRLELVQIDEQQGQPRAVAARQRQGRVQPVEEQGPVGQIGQRVVIGQVGEPGMGLGDLRQVQFQLLGPAPQFQMQPHPSPHHRRVDGLVDEIDPAGLQGAGLALGVGAGGDEDHRDVASGRVRLEPFTDLITIQVGHHDIEQDQVGNLALGERIERLLAGGHEPDLIVLLQDPQQDLDIGRHVIDNQDVRWLISIHGILG